MFERFGDGEDAFFFEGPANDLYADGKAFAGKAEREGDAREPGKIEPLRIAHVVKVAGAGLVISLAVTKRRRGGNRREKDWKAIHLAENFFAEKVALGASRDKKS